MQATFLVSFYSKTEFKLSLQLKILNFISWCLSLNTWFFTYYKFQNFLNDSILFHFNVQISQILCDVTNFESVSSVAQLYLTLCDPMDCSTPGLPVHHQLPEYTQTHVHWVGDAIQPSHPLSSHSPPALKLSQHQGLFKWVSSLH